MSQPAPTFNQIRAKVLAVRRKVPDARFFGIRSAGRYAGERLRHDGAEVYRIEQCDSPLAARIALLDEEPGATATVLITSLPDQDLGDDVLVRLAKRQFFEINPWEIVKELFQAQAIDPRLRAHNWIADRLLDLAPAGGLTPTPGGYLDAEEPGLYRPKKDGNGDPERAISTRAAVLSRTRDMLFLPLLSRKLLVLLCGSVEGGRLDVCEFFRICARCASRARRVCSRASLSSLFSALTVSSSRRTCRAFTASPSSGLAMRPMSRSFFRRCAAVAAATSLCTRSSFASIIS